VKRISIKNATHIEAPGCIVNITPGLSGAGGRQVTSIEIICDQYAGEQHWYLPDINADRPPRATNIRVVQETETDMRERMGR